MANKDIVWLKNNNSVKTEVFSQDGDSVHIIEFQKALVEKKFLWKLPSGVEEYQENFVVFGKKTREMNIVEKSGNLQGVEDNRTTVTSDNKPSESNLKKTTV